MRKGRIHVMPGDPTIADRFTMPIGRVMRLHRHDECDDEH
jgi:hypothetical protein